jgi:hypothetical protein
VLALSVHGYVLRRLAVVIMVREAREMARVALAEVLQLDRYAAFALELPPP